LAQKKSRFEKMTMQPLATPADAGLGLFEKWLSIWVGAAILLGLLIGNIAPDAVAGLAGLEYASVNLVVAVLIWAMIYPMMVGVDFASLKHIGEKPKGLFITIVVNWLIKPFTMAALAVLFFQYIYAGLISSDDAQQYIAGLILLGAAPCTAMVFVWSQMTKGDPAYTLVQVSVNDIIMIFAFAPLVALLLGVTDIAVPWETLLLSVVLYVVIPLVAGALTRRTLLARSTDGEAAIAAFTGRVKPLSVLFISYAAAWAWKVPHNVAAPCALIGTSNFFELAVAVAIGVFGLGSGAALATVVGVSVEVPVMLSLVAFANRTRSKFTAP
jgi:arsenite transporter